MTTTTTTTHHHMLFGVPWLHVEHILIGGAVALVVAVPFFLYHIRKARKLAKELPQITAKALKKGEIQTEILLQSVADGIIVTDTTGKITLINHAAAELVGWPAVEAVSLNVNSVLKLLHEDGSDVDSQDNPFTSVIRDKQAFKSVMQLVPKSGTNRIVSVVVSPVALPPNYELVGAIAVLRDVSRQHQEEAQRAEFISTASHEMRTPVAAIEGYLALAMNDRVSKIDTKAREYLEKAHASTQHLGKLFQDLLTSARAEDGRLSSHSTVVEVGSMLEQLSQDLKFGAEKKGLNLELVFGSADSITDARESNTRIIKPLYYIYADPDRIAEVITNLVDNAIKYTDSGKVTIGLTGDNQVVQMFIRDTGPGIAPEDVPHLFQKFYRVNNTLTRTIGGTGLGLFISRKIVELYKGRVWVESTVGKGSTFYVNIPRLSAEKATQMKTANSDTSTDTPTKTTTVG